MTVIEIARLFAFVREAAPNRGVRVEAIQHWSGGEFGDSWCMEMVWLWFDLAAQGKAPWPREQSTESARQLAELAGWIVALEALAVGDIAFSINPETGRAHHVALVTCLDPLTTIAGNTSEDGVSANGTGVFEHPITADGKVFARIPL